jgi:uncharacterized protein (DUF1499 family)
MWILNFDLAMKKILSLLKAIAVSIFLVSTITLSWAVPSLAVTTNHFAALPLVKNIFAGTPPDNIGVHDGLLTPCPASPNCVVTQDADEAHSIKPITYKTDLNTARETLLKVLTVVPGTEVIKQTNNYIRAQSTSRLMGFIDDVEFYFPSEDKVIEMRSASRLGESDLGVNRRRLEQIRFAMEDLKV